MMTETRAQVKSDTGSIATFVAAVDNDNLEDYEDGDILADSVPP